MSIFANPMMLLMGFSILMMFAMPKMMEGLDPEALEEVKQSQARAQSMLNPTQAANNNMPDFAQQLANFMAPPSTSKDAKGKK